MTKIRDASHVQLLVLGPGAVIAADGSGASIPLQPKRLALLTYLAMAHPRGVHRREALAALLWTNVDDRRARNALSQALHGVRKAVGADSVESQGREALRISPSHLSCDAVWFEDLLDERRYEDALELWGGELLRGIHVAGALGFERWLEGERARLRRRARDATRALAEQARGSGNPVAAVRWMEQGLTFSPSDETAARALMEMLDRLGDRAGALAAYERLTRHLADQFDAEPAPETKDLIERVRSRTLVDTGSEPPTQSGTADVDNPDDRLCLAVLPLLNLTGDPSQEFFADGMTEMLIGELARSTDLVVLSRQSVAGFKDSKQRLGDIADRLGADLVLEGSVLRAGTRVRIAAQLLRADPEEHLWADAFEDSTEDILGLQRETAQQVARAVAERVSSDRTVAWRERATPTHVVPEAYDEFLRGIVRFQETTPETLPEVLGHFARAIEIDPSFGEAHAWVAFAWANAAYTGGVPFAVAREHARTAIDQAMHRAPDVGAVRAIHATVVGLERDWEAARAEFRMAHDLGVGDMRAFAAQVLFLAGRGQFQEALAMAQEGVRHDPTGAPYSFLVGWVHFRARRFHEAVDRLSWTLGRWPQYFWTNAFLAASHLFAGWPARALDVARDAVAKSPPIPTILAYHGATLARAGAEAEGRDIRDRLFHMQSAGYVDPYPLAVAHAGLGDYDDALDSLERLVTEGSGQSWSVAIEVFFDPLRETDRFRAVLDSLELPHL